MGDQTIETDERFHPLVEGTTAAIIVFDSDRVLYINPAAKVLTGRSARELLGRPIASLFPTELHRLFRSGYSTAGTRPEQVQLLRKGGDKRWVDLSLMPILFRRQTATMATLFDIHHLKESELARREAEVQLKLVQRAGRTVSWDWKASSDELTVYGLPKRLVMNGAPTLTTTGRSFLEQVRPDDLVSLKQAIRAALQDQEAIFLELCVVDLEGERHWIVLRGQAVPDRRGVTEHVVGVATDITERRRAEQALITEQENTLAMLASVTDGMIRADLRGVVQDLSAPAESITGWTLRDAKGQPLTEILPLINEESGDPLPDPVAACLDQPDSLGPPQTCLLARAEKEDLPIRFHTSLLRDQSFEPTGVILVIKDLNEHKQVERGMVYLATHDPLTDLVNRTEFERQFGRALEAVKQARRQDSVLYMDLDGFKLINDTFGHPAGDKMLKQFASFLKCRFRETDTLGRLGGDKFGVLLENCPTWQARELVEKLYKDLRGFQFEWEDTSLPVSLSTGLGAFGPETEDVERVLGAAEAACYLAKQKGGDRYYEYEPKELAASDRHSQLEVLHQVQDALRLGSFELHAQLIQPLTAKGSNPCMYEVLVRMLDRNGGLIMPNDFIPIAERHRIMSAIDRWVLSRTLEVVAEHTRLQSDHQTLFAVNISGQSLGDDRFLEFVLHELSYRGVDPARICLEITETATVANFDKAQRFISVLKGRGCRFVLDDFGSGLSSFAYLRNFPVDFIKIDGQFVQGLTKDPTQRALVESINHVGHVMHIKTIAEAVESLAVLEAVEQMKIDYAQGHGISRPAPIQELLALAHPSPSTAQAEI